MLRVITALALLVLAAGTAQARHFHGRAPVPVTACDGWDVTQSCGLYATAPGWQTRQRVPQAARGAVVAHPAGCPARAFCGCGASVRVFGRPVRGLYLAAAWLRFPRAAHAPGMVAARSHHVMVLEQHVSGDDWLVYDANSGGHATRLHVRSIRGYAIVNPRA